MSLSFWSPLELCCAQIFFLSPYFGCFFIGKFSCLMSKFSTVTATSFKCFLGLFLVGLANKEGIIIFLFVPALDMFHCLILVFQNLFNFWKFHISFSELVFYHKYGSLILCREFNKWVMNVSSSILCPVFANSVHFFSKKANQSIGVCLVFSSL